MNSFTDLNAPSPDAAGKAEVAKLPMLATVTAPAAAPAAPAPTTTIAGGYLFKKVEDLEQLRRSTVELKTRESERIVALQEEELFQRLHLKLYEAFFTRGKNISIPEEVFEVVRESGADMTRFLADYESGKTRESVLHDYEDARTRDGVRAIPTVLVNGGRRLVGLVSGVEYRRTLEAVASE